MDNTPTGAPSGVIAVGLPQSQAFSRLSGDFNPLHIDPLIARRLQFGSTVAHGIHILLCALDAVLIARIKPIVLTALKAEFLSPLPTGQSCSLDYSETTAGEGVIKLNGPAGPCQRITVSFAAAAPSTAMTGTAGHTHPVVAPQEPTWDKIPALTEDIPLTFDHALAEQLFPHATKTLPAWQIGILLASTRIVGMRVPGLNSVYANLTLAFTSPDSAPETLRYTVLKADRRLNLIRLCLETAGATGTLTSLVRASPVQQPDFAATQQSFASNYHAGKRAIIIGGSRGLGEVTAKLLAAGKADVVITYNLGRGDAEAIASQIIGHGSRCRAAHYNAESGETDLGEVLPSDWSPTHVYYFSTPAIRLNRGAFDSELFEMFRSYYVDGFLRCINVMSRLFPGKPTPVFIYPSTVYVDTPPGNALEYSAAKAAGEVVCRGLTNRTPALTTTIWRLPRVLTDQTAGDLGKSPPAAIDVIANFLRGDNAARK